MIFVIDNINTTHFQ